MDERGAWIATIIYTLLDAGWGMADVTDMIDYGDHGDWPNDKVWQEWESDPSGFAFWLVDLYA